MFASKDIEQAYNARYARMKDVINKKIPDRVPVVLNAETWVLNYAGVNVRKALTEDNDLLVQAYKKYLADIYNDALFDVSNTASYKLAGILGDGVYKVTDDNVHVVGGKGEIMKPDEYSQLIADHQKYITNVYAPRKFPIFEQSLEKNIELMKVVFDEFVAYGKYNADAAPRGFCL